MSTLESWKVVESSPSYIEADPEVQEAVRAEFQRRHGAIPEDAPAGNALRAAGERVGDLVGNFIKATDHHPLTKGANAVQDFLYGKFSDTFGKPVFGDGLIPRWNSPQDLKKRRQAGDPAGNRASFSGLKRSVADAAKNIEFGYVPKNTNETLKEAWKQKGILGAMAKTPGFMFEQGLKSVPDMVAAGTAPVPYVAALSQEIAEERTKNKSLLGGSSGEPSTADFLASVPFAAGVMALERIVPKMFSNNISNKQATAIAEDIMRGGAANAAATQALKGGATEFTTEALQEGVIQYVGERLGTEAEMKASEAFERGAFAGLAGVGMGTSMGGVSGAIAATRKPVEGYDSGQTIGEEELDAEFSDQPPMLPAPEAHLGLPPPQGKLPPPQDRLPYLTHDGEHISDPLTRRAKENARVTEIVAQNVERLQDRRVKKLSADAQEKFIAGQNRAALISEARERENVFQREKALRELEAESQTGLKGVVARNKLNQLAYDAMPPRGSQELTPEEVLKQRKNELALAEFEEKARRFEEKRQQRRHQEQMVNEARQQRGIAEVERLKAEYQKKQKQGAALKEAEERGKKAKQDAALKRVHDYMEKRDAAENLEQMVSELASQWEDRKSGKKPKEKAPPTHVDPTGQAEPEETPALILTTKGAPFKSQAVAARAIKNRGLGNSHEVVAHEGGYAVAKKGSAKTSEQAKKEAPPKAKPAEKKRLKGRPTPENRGVDAKTSEVKKKVSKPISDSVAPSIFGQDQESEAPTTEESGSPAIAEKRGTATTEEIQAAPTADLFESMRAIRKDFYRGLSNVQKDIVKRLESGREVSRDEALEVVTAHRDHWIERERKFAEADANELANSERLYGSKTMAELEKEHERLGGTIGGLQNMTEIGDGRRSTRDAVRNEAAREYASQRMRLERYIEHRKENEAKSKESSEEKSKPITHKGVSVTVPAISKEVEDQYNRTTHIGRGRDFNAELEGEAKDIIDDLAGRKNHLDTADQKTLAAELITGYLKAHADFIQWESNYSASNPSWLVTGRSGRNMAKARAKNDRHMEQYTKRVDNLESRKHRIRERVYEARPESVKAEQRFISVKNEFINNLTAILSPMTDGKKTLAADAKKWAGPKALKALDEALDMDKARAMKMLEESEAAIKKGGLSGLVSVFGARSNTGRRIKELLQPAAENNAPTTQAPESLIERFTSVSDKVMDGALDSEGIKAEWAEYKKSKDDIKAAVSKMTKAKIFESAPYLKYRYRNDKKAQVVDAFIDQVEMGFVLSGSIQYDPFKKGGRSAAIDSAVESYTDESVKEYAEQAKAKKAERQARAQETIDAIRDPKTYDDYKKFINYKGEDKLTDEQRERWETLQADKELDRRSEEKEKRNTVEAIDGDHEFEFVETKHTKTGEDLFVVVPKARLGKELFREFSGKAKAMGGWYPRGNYRGKVAGFHFKEKAVADKFMALLSEGDQDITEQASAKEADKTAKKSAKIRALAEKLKAKSEAAQNQDRKTNTAKRAREAGHAIEQAYRDGQFADTLLRIADGIDNGDVKYLAGISNKAQVSEIESRLNYAKYKANQESAKGKSFNEREEDRHREPTEKDIKHAEMPYPMLYRDGLSDLAKNLYNTHGGKTLSKQIEKAKIVNASIDNKGYKFKTESDLALARKISKKLGKDTAWQISDSLEKYDRLVRAGIDSDAMLKSALREYMEYRGGKKTESKAAKLERELIGDRSVGIDFFPTPLAQADYIVGLADIEAGMNVLEPSAGNGHLAEAISKLGAHPDVIELSPTLRDVLEAKGYRVAGNDFMEFDAEGAYDRIVMNPPFSKRMDAEHVMHAYKMLKPGGRLVSIMGEGVFFGSDKKAVEFREWLDEQDGTSEKLPEKFFMDKNNIKTTGVNSRVVIIDKPLGNDGKFSASAEPKPGMLAEEIEGQIDTELEGLRAKGAKINVVQSQSDLPKTAKEHLAKHPSLNVRGYYEPATGTMYLVAENITNRSEALKVLEHEVIGHWSVEKILGNEFGTFAKRVNALRKTGVKPVKQMVSRLKDIYGDDFNRLSDEVIASEVIAMLAEQHVDKSPVAKVLSDLYAKAVKAVRKGLEAMGFDTGFTMNDISIMLIRARNNQDLTGSSTASEVGKFSIAHERPNTQKGQYVDKAFRLLFKPFGTIDEHNRFQPPEAVQRKVNKFKEGIRKNYETHFTWAKPTLDKMGFALLDRFGLPHDYVEREKSVPLDKRVFLMRARKLIEKMSEVGIGNLEQAKAFQAILTNERPPTAQWQALSAEIRNEITEMGRQAVDLGLITQEQFERNRASYLHRSYQKFEHFGEEKKGMRRKLDTYTTNKRRRIQGEELKQRGVDNNIPNERLAEIVSGERPITVETREIMASLGGSLAMNQRLKLVSRARLDGMVQSKYLVEGAPTPVGWQDRGVWEVAKFGATTTRLRKPAEIRVNMEIRSAYKTLEDGKIRRKYLIDNEPTPAGYRDEGKWYVRKVGEKNSILHRDFTKEEREEMGEILDARYNIARTYQLLGHDLAVGKFYKDLSENTDWAKNELEEGDTEGEPGGRWTVPEPGSWVKVPATKIAKGDAYKYGKLANMYVRAEIWRDLNEIEALQGDSLWRDLTRWWKKTKTVYNPVTHWNNVVANFVIMDLADVRMRDLWAGIQSYYNKDEYHHDAMVHGAFGSSMVDQELKNDILAPILKELKQEIEAEGDSVMSRFKILSKISNYVQAADELSQSTYQLEDEIFRMAYFRKLIDQGYGGREAAVLAREQFIDYDIHAPLINELRNGKLAFLPFISFTYRAVPLLLRALRYKPWKFAKYAAIMHGANALGYAIAGGDEEEIQKTLPSQKKGNTIFGTPRMLRLPWQDHNGDPAFIDMRRAFPLADVVDIDQGSTALPWPAPLNPGGPLAIVLEIALNKIGFFGKEITNREIDTPVEQFQKVGGYLWQQFMPGHIPGGYYWDKWWGAVLGETDRLGRDYSVLYATLSSLGPKVQGHNVEMGRQSHMFRLQQEVRHIRAELRRRQRERQRNMIDEQEYQKYARKAREKIGLVREKLRALN